MTQFFTSQSYSKQPDLDQTWTRPVPDLDLTWHVILNVIQNVILNHFEDFFVKRVFIVNLKQKYLLDRKLFEQLILLISCHIN